MTPEKRSWLFKLTFTLSVSIFVISIILKYIYDIEVTEDAIGLKISYINFVKALFLSNEKYGIILLLLAITGIFLKNKITWGIIATFSYFYLMNNAINSYLYIFSHDSDNYSNWTNSLFLIFPLLILCLMNLKYITEMFIGKAPSLFILNLISIIIAMLMIYLRWILFKNNDISKYLFDMVMV